MSVLTPDTKKETQIASAMGVLKGAYPTAVDNDVLQNLFNFQCLSLDYTLIESYAEHPSDPASSMTTSTTMAYWERNYFVTLTLGYQMCFTSPISLYCVLYCISMPTAMSEVKARLSREGKTKTDEYCVFVGVQERGRKCM